MALGSLLEAVHAAVIEGLSQEAGETAFRQSASQSSSSRFLADRHLMAFLLCRLRPSKGDVAVAQALLEEPDPAVVVAARQFVAVEKTSGPLCDMPRRLRERLIWTVAAALRESLVSDGMTPASADATLGPAGKRFLAALAAREGPERRAEILVASVRAAGSLSHLFIRRCALEGAERILAAALAALSGICTISARALMIGVPQGMALLLRGAGLDREEAIAILEGRGGISSLHESGADGLVEAVDAFDALSGAEARQALCLWRTDEIYRNIVVGEGAE